jgi:hypothetical protein
VEQKLITDPLPARRFNRVIAPPMRSSLLSRATAAVIAVTSLWLPAA